MLEISPEDIQTRLNFDNPWWENTRESESIYATMPDRSYLAPFVHLVSQLDVRRAVILMGPRRVGKTVILQQTIRRLLDAGVAGNRILFLSLETPIYTGCALEQFVLLFQARFKHTANTPLFIFFDEIQYLKDWEIHLKSLVDSFPTFRFVASGSAAAALRLKSRESGAGRFTKFLLPPLSFAEFLRFIKKEEEMIELSADYGFVARDIQALNAHFLEYLNIGGYPEAVLNETVRRNSDRFIKSDIIDKVLLRDLPQLYGIRDIQELNRLFTTLAYNTGNEVSLEELSRTSGVSKTTLSRYLEYLEAAFLIKRVYRIDHNARRFQRATAFKVYLTNPSMHSALFGTLASDDKSMGALAETAMFAQWFHDPEFIENIHYARWPTGEIDMVALDSKTQKPIWCVEVKWSDRPSRDRSMLEHLADFSVQHGLETGLLATTLTWTGIQKMQEISIPCTPTSLQVYKIGQNLTQKLLGNMENDPRQQTLFPGN